MHRKDAKFSLKISKVNFEDRALIPLLLREGSFFGTEATKGGRGGRNARCGEQGAAGDPRAHAQLQDLRAPPGHGVSH